MLRTAKTAKDRCHADGCGYARSTPQWCELHEGRMARWGKLVDPNRRAAPPAPEPEPKPKPKAKTKAKTKVKASRSPQSKTCTIDDCGAPTTARSMCVKHYWRALRAERGHETTPRGTGRTCTIDGCGQPHKAKGLCLSHYNRFRLTGDPTGLPVCEVDGCDKPRGHGHITRPMCMPHYRAWKASQVCATEGCGRPLHSRGCCSSCYEASRRGHTPDMSRRGRSARQACTVDGCDQWVHSRGLCSTHLWEWKKKNPSPCKDCGRLTPASRCSPCKTAYTKARKENIR